MEKSYTNKLLHPGLTLLLIFLLIFGGRSDLFASHAMGGDIYYECINPATNTYRITFVFYRDCSGISAPSSVNITGTSSCGSTSVTAYLVGNGVDVSPLCPSQISRCSGGSNPGVERYVYQATISNLTPCTNWTFYTGINARNGAITTGPSGTLHIQTTLNSVAAPCNSSPQFATIPVPYVCINNPVNYSQGATDPDGDSLAYALVQPRTGLNSFVNFNFPYSPTYPLSTASGTFGFNPVTGGISFTPNLIQVGVLAIEVREYRNGVLIGTTIRDIQITVLNCNNQSPNTGGIFNVAGGDTVDNFTARVCPNSNISFNINSTDPDGDQITLTSNVASQIPAASFTSNSPSTSISANFSWTPTNNDRGSHTFIIELVDDGCPISARSSHAVTIIVDSVMEAGPDTFIRCDQPVQLLAFGGDSFTWSPAIGLSNPNVANPVASNTVPTMYTVVSNCGSDSVFVGIQGPSHTVDAGQTDTVCTGAPSNLLGSVNPAGNYTYRWSPAQTLSDSTIINPVANPLSTTRYFLTAIDGPCEVTDSVDIVTISSSFNIAETVNNVSCNGGNDGSITVVASNGQPPYTYSINGGANQANGIFNNLSAGTYTINITDNIFCDSTFSIIVTEPTPLGLQVVNVDSVLCNGDATGQIEVQGTGGTPGYLYNVNAGPQQASGVFNNLSAANYTVRVTDTNGCFVNQVVPVYEPTPLNLAVNLIDSADCAGLNDGRITVAASGGINPYQYQIDTAAYQGSGNFPGLTAGTYTIVTQDQNGCTDTVFPTVLEPAPLALALNTDSVNCFGGSDGTIFSFPSGGITPYRYSMNGVNYQGGSGFQNLSAGVYTVYVRDRNQCNIVDSVEVHEPSPVSVGIDSTWMVTCFGFANGGASAIATGGTGAYSYSMNGITFQGSNSFSGLAPGSYSIIVNDHYQCADTTGFNITQPTPLSLSVDAVDSANCTGFNDGSILVSSGGATPPYQYNINGQAFVNSGLFDSLVAGTYTIITTDSNQCLDTAVVDVYEPTPISAVFTTVDSVSCTGYSDGTIIGLGSGGTGTLLYSIDTGVTFQTSGVFSGQPAGAIRLTVQDHHQCEINIDTVVPEPTPLVATLTIDSVNCNGGNDGSITISASGGTSPLNYSLTSVFQQGSSFNNLVANPYTVSIRDRNGCLLQLNDTVHEPAVVQISLDTLQNISCFNGNDGQITVSATGGSGTYRFRANNGMWQTSQVFNNLTQGAFNIDVIDYHGCQDSLFLTLTQPIVLSFAITKVDSISCHNAADGEIVVTTSGGTAPYRYSIDGVNFQRSPIFSNIGPGTYTVTLLDTNNCQRQENFTLFNPLAIRPSIAGLDHASCFGLSDGYIEVAPINGFSPFLYSMDSISYQSTGVFPNLTANTYTIYVRDRKGCEESVNIVVNQPTRLDLNLTKTDITCYGYDNGSITALANGGVPPYQFRLNAGPFGANNTFSNLGPNPNHQVTVEDANGCLTPATIAVVEPPQLTSIAVTTDVTCFGGQDGTITFSANGGTPGYIYEHSIDGLNWYNNNSGFFDNLPVGNYDLRVRDANFCLYEFNTLITEPVRTITTIETDSVSCYGYSDGRITASSISPLNPEKAPFAYSVDGVNYQFDNTIGSLSSQTYTLFTRDAEGCIDSIQFFMPEPQLQVVTLNPDPMNLELGDSMQVSLNLDGRPNLNSVQYRWFPIHGLSCSDCAEPVISTVYPTTYTVTVTENGYGCEAEATITVNVSEPDPIFVPNIFTPNGDGFNDYVWVFGNDLEQIEFQIYDRWGEKVFETVDQEIGWDGTFRGKPARPGVYTWSLNGLYIDGTNFREAGTVTLYR